MNRIKIQENDYDRRKNESLLFLSACRVTVSQRVVRVFIY